MSNKSRFLGLRILNKLLAILIMFIILASTTNVTAQLSEEENIRLGISNPGEIPSFHSFVTPGIVPGNTGKLEFSIENRYNFTDDNTMRNITLVVNIYEYSTLEENKNIQTISNAPEITGGSEGLRFLPDKQTARFFWPVLDHMDVLEVSIDIKTKSTTPEGRYFVRTHLTFTFSNYTYDMKSRAHFTDSKWDLASKYVTDQSGWIKINETVNHLVAGRLNLTTLGVDGVIPETSFRVLTPIPTWPLYLCLIPLILAFIAGFFIFFLMDEHGKFPHLKKKLDAFGKKLEDFRYRRK